MLFIVVKLTSRMTSLPKREYTGFNTVSVSNCISFFDFISLLFGIFICELSSEKNSNL